MPIEGVFENCALDTEFQVCASRLAVMAAGGVRVVVIPAMNSSLVAMWWYAATAHRLGMKVMWEIGDPNWWQQAPDGTQVAYDIPELATACGCARNRELLIHLVDFLRALPGTYGYYAADDTRLRPGDETAITAYIGLIKQLDPNHPTMIGVAGARQRDAYQSISDLIGQEIYPVATKPILPRNAHLGAWAHVSRIAAAAQSSADRAGKASAFILQAFTWGDNLSDGEALGVCSPRDTLYACSARLRYPSGAAQLALRNAILDVAHPALILWWSFPGTYGFAAPNPNYVYPSGAQAAARWDGLSDAIQAPWPTKDADSRRPHIPAPPWW